MNLADLGTYPQAHALPPGYDRHHPSTARTRQAVELMVAQSDWAVLRWADLFCGLAAVGRTDIPLARLTEGHVDAVRILAEAGRAPVPGSLYGVWASRSHRTGLLARPTAAGWSLSGTLRFASGAGVVDRALVPVWPNPDEHVLVDVDVTGWVADASQWQTRAMQVSRSHTFVVVDHRVDHDAEVGDPGFYLGRRGFFPGGVGVAAVWAGGAARLLDLVLDHAASAAPSASRSIRLGQVRIELAAAQALVVVAAEMLQTHPDLDLRQLSTLTRSGVGAAVRRAVDHVRQLAGAAGLAFAGDLTRAVDDLDLYVRQLNPDAEAEFLGAFTR
jgi:hypothetical protein